MKKKNTGSFLDPRPLPVGYLLVGFIVFVAGLIFWFSGRLSTTWAILAVMFGGILVFASFRSLKE